jgi:hypothetical protein
LIFLPGQGVNRLLGEPPVAIRIPAPRSHPCAEIESRPDRADKNPLVARANQDIIALLEESVGQCAES